MKKLLLCVFCLVLLLPASVFAGSDDDDKQFYKGIRLGYQNSNFSESEWDDLNSFYVGVFGAKKFGAGKLLSLYTGLEYYQTGSVENDDNKIVLSYLSLPINLRLKLGPVYAFGGFNPSFKIGETAKASGIDISDNLDAEVFDVGGQVGVGVKFLFLGLELKYNQGLIDVFEDNTTHHLQAGLCVYF
jgi:hypothetical protein